MHAPTQWIGATRALDLGNYLGLVWDFRVKKRPHEQLNQFDHAVLLSRRFVGMLTLAAVTHRLATSHTGGFRS